MSQIVTGEAVALDLRVARAGSRSIALALDFIIGLLTILLMVFLFGRIDFLDGAAQQALTLVLYIGVLIGYPVAFETFSRGRTPGKAAMGLRVVRDDGGPVRFRHALIRALVGAIVELPTLFAAAIISSLASERGKRLGDRAAGTVVIQERVPRSRAMAVVPMPPPLVGWAATLDLSRVSNDLALGIRQFFERSAELTPQARDRLGQSLIDAVLPVIAPAPPAGAPGWAILAAVLAERRNRDSARLQHQQQRLAAAKSPTWQGYPNGDQARPGWGAGPAAPPWQASSPATGQPSSPGPPPVLPQPTAYPPPPPVAPAPQPVPASLPVPATPPPPDGFHLPF